MNVPGLSDSVVGIAERITECPVCGTEVRVNGGFCLSCLLRLGLDNSIKSNPGDFDDVMTASEVRDSEWRLGNYQILEEIGRGGMGVIYRARQRHSRRVVALKRVLSYHGDSRETLERFRREAEAAASLDHPNILPIFEVSESEGLPYFTMKYAAGGSLQQVAASYSAEPRECGRLLAKIARAVAFAHREGILHRDLKPGNILLDARGEPMVSDFGLAKWIDASTDLTRSLTIFGTPGYIAPEQAEGAAAALTPAADVYSLGAILFDLLTGRPPFLGEHALAVIKQAEQAIAPKLRSLVRTLDRDLETLCAKCLERDPRARYRSANDLAEDLERWLEGRPIIARPVLPPMRVWRWSKRNLRFATSIVACLVLATVALVWQIQSRHLTATVREKQLAAHSMTVVPFLDLDTISADGLTAEIVATALQSQIPKFGLAKVIVETEPSTKWTGAGILDEVQSTARRTRSRTVLTGTVRHVGKETRVSMHLISENGTDVLGKWILDVDGTTAISHVIAQKEIAAIVYKALDGRTEAIDSLQTDQTMINETARAYFNAGRGLLDRRTIADMDRAIACFEAAIRAAPRSVAARSSLAMAYMGRNYLLSSPQSTERAYQVAQDAIELAPENPIANRGLCYVAEARGRYTEALQFGLRAIELGDQSERAFGQVAYAWKMLGRPDKAILWYRKAKASNQQPADYDALLGDCYTALGLDDQARLAYETATTFRPDLPEGWMGLVYLKLINGDFAAARDLLSARSQEYAAFPVANQLAALVDFFSRRYAQAERQYDLLSSADSIGIGAQHYGAISYTSALARLKQEREDMRDATSLIDSCIAVDMKELEHSQPSDTAEVLYRLAADHAVAQNATLAISYLERSVAKGWLDYRSPAIDPRFDALANNPQFKRTLDDLAARVADLRR